MINLNLNKISAFSLAEIILVLTIIGIVAALSIPSLIQSTQNAEYVAGVKHISSVLSQVGNLIMIDNAGTMGGVFQDNNSLVQTFCTKLNCTKTCLYGQDPGVCFYAGNTSWKALGGDYGWRDMTNTSRAILNNGTLIALWLKDKNCNNGMQTRNGVGILCAWLIVDINGFKGPNIMGRDLFEFAVTKYGVIPYSYTDHTACDPVYYPMGDQCAARILIEGRMNY